MPPDTLVDFQLIVHPILEVLGLMIAAFISAYVPKAINALALWAKVKLTDQQRTQMKESIETAVGKIETKLDQKVLSLSHINIDDPTVREEARSAVQAVVKAATALNVTPEDAARMIVGKIDTSFHVETPVVSAPAVTVISPVAPSIIPAS